VINHEQAQKILKQVEEKDVKRYLNDQNLTGCERFEMVMMKAKQIEQKALLDE
jgi:hypothetical protein